MSATFTSLEICELALRKIGAYSMADSAARGEEVAEALYWLDMGVAHLAETKRVQWLIPTTFSMELSANTPSYDIADALGSSAPADGLLFPVEAYVRDSSGFDQPIRIVRRHEYEEIPDKDEAGRPQLVYIDRLADLSLRPWPIPNTGDYSLRLVFQTYAPTLTDNKGRNQHGFSAGWQLWMVTNTAALIGDGPVRKLPANEVDRMKRDAVTLMDDLIYSNREKVSEPRRTRAWGQ